jgi:hypothetical protein
VAGTGAFLPLSVIREIASAPPAQREQFFNALANQAAESIRHPEATARAMTALDFVCDDFADTLAELAKMITPEWIPIEAVIDEHRKQIDRHGGDHALRDLDLPESALARALIRLPPT